jgi:hypothetical protein
MPDPHTDPNLYAECLAAMAASGEGYPCETLAPAQPDPQAALSEPTERT